MGFVIDKQGNYLPVFGESQGGGSEATRLASGTTLTVKTDGSGDFTTIQDAISYLNGKWCEGVVTIQLGNGTFTFDSNLNFNFIAIKRLNLTGSSLGETILSDTRTTLSSNQYSIRVNMPYFSISKLSLQGSASSYAKESIGILVESEASLATISNVSIDHFSIGIQSTASKVQISNTINISDCGYTGFRCRGAGVLCSNWAPAITLNTIGSYGFAVDYGGIISLTNPNITYTSVSTHTSQTVGTATNDGWITGVTV